MIWYVADLARFRAEREALEALANEVDWVKPVGWKVDSRLRMFLNLEIAAGGSIHALRLRYPESFPNSPPSLLPQDGSAVLSGHQYGPGGELCLEYRADNWTPDLTGRRMVESAYRLLRGEKPAPNERAVVASAHQTTAGQKLRNEIRRLILPRTIKTKHSRLLPESGSLSAKARVLNREGALLYVIDTLELPEGKFIDPSVPPVLAEEGTELTATLVRVPPDIKLPRAGSLDKFNEACAALGADSTVDLVVFFRQKSAYAFRILKNLNLAYSVAVVPLPKTKSRLATGYDVLSGKSVAVIGCGSLGSKIATSLARSGVGKFLLIDDDLLTPDNLVRNDLDWRDVGLNKADALSTRIRLVNPPAKVRARRVRLAGQESAESADDVLISMAECDLIIDATASPAALNVISGVSLTSKIPVVWAEVFAGGIGGLIARFRPSLEPSIPLMRRAIENWFSEQGAAPVAGGLGYDQDSEENPLIADDGDVSAIAAPAVRMAVDCLLARTPSLFANSAYAIGLAPGSVFSQPFEVFPIEFPTPPAEENPLVLKSEDAEEELSSIHAIIKGSFSEADSDKKDA